MRVSLRLIVVAGLIAVLASAYGPVWAQSRAGGSAPIKFTPLVENVRGGQIDWGAEMMYASGEGAMPSASEEHNRARAKLKAKEYAKMAAIANLLMLIEGTSISYNATGKDFMASDVTLKQTIEGYVRNVRVARTVSRTEEGDTIIKVTVCTPMYGRDKPGNALLAKLSETELEETEPTPVRMEIVKEAPKTIEVKPVAVADEPKEEPKPDDAKVEDERPDTPPAPDAPVVGKVADEPKPKPVMTNAVVHTSVVIDTLGFNVMRAMSPKLRAKNGQEVWGTLKMDYDEIQDHGPVAYVRSVADAKKCSRAGSSPLVLKAIGRAGGSRMCDVVLSDEDVATLNKADQSANPSFLAALKVIVVVDPTKAF